jgi:hypothetical protein
MVLLSIGLPSANPQRLKDAFQQALRNPQKVWEEREIGVDQRVCRSEALPSGLNATEAINDPCVTPATTLRVPSSTPDVGLWRRLLGTGSCSRSTGAARFAL